MSLSVKARGMAGSPGCVGNGVWSDHLGAMRQHPVMVTEVDLRLPPDGHYKREVPVAEPVEVQGAVQPGEPSDQLEADGFGSDIEGQPGRIHPPLLGTGGTGERKGDQPHHRRTPHCC